MALSPVQIAASLIIDDLATSRARILRKATTARNLTIQARTALDAGDLDIVEELLDCAIHSLDQST